jgi:K+-sensing histidine kinase KdpD
MIAAALRCLILITVFAMARLSGYERAPAFDIVIGIGAAYVVLSTIAVRTSSDVRRRTLVMLAVDVLLISALITAQEGVRSEYYVLYYLPIIHASIRLNFRDAAGTCVLAAASYLLVGMLERPDSAVTTTVLSRVLTFAVSAAVLAGFFILLARDQRAFHALSERYRRATQGKSEFLSRISHEFRTPLTAIVGFSQLLHEHEDDLDPSRQHDYLTVIREQSQELARMIEDILDIARVEDNELRLHPEAVKLSEAIDSAMLLLDRPTDRERVAVTVTPGTPMVWADRHETEQVLNRLLHTALTLTGDGEQAELHAGLAERGDDEVLLRVTAPGLAVDEQDLALLFGPSAAVLTERPSSGRALGLAASRVLVELQGGRIWVDDAEGAGASINFTLPKHRRAEGAPEVILAEAGAGDAVAEAHGEDQSDDSGRRPVRAEAGAGQPEPLR